MAVIEHPPIDITEPVLLGDPVAAIDRALDNVAAEARTGWSPTALSARVRDLAGMNQRTEVELVRALVRWEAEGAFGVDGYLSALSWLIRETNLARGVASRLLDVARLCGRHDQVATALFAGVLPMAKAAALARFDTPERREIFARDLDRLLGAIGRLDVEHAAKLINHWSRIADNEIGREPADSRANQRLHASRTFNGMVVLDALLDPETGAIVLAVLEALDHPDPVDSDVPPRTLAQRRADALAEMARRSLGSDGHVDPDKTVNVVIDAELLDLFGDTDTADGDECSATAATLTKRCEILGHGPVNPLSVKRMICDSWISRVIVGADGVILDLGRRQRLFSPSQRRAITIRDQHCVFPGCNCQPEWCDVHHLAPWEVGGPTDLENGALLCRRHHHLVHEGGWILKRGLLGTWTASPP